ncbi:ribonuclease Z [Alkalibacillus salilacus]|uniref:Ribonuclease Z n=1 Tax=Alkalibacillus salilacus TaxID=284582 RepID=A0ABT9VCC1_9BACI|nr:ribonuclease Z [Alkalibacillus salilacus]MDQ0158554.1 ribonuclease Z [Alkalibacillus salilacus]
MELTFLGTGSGVPSKQRNVSSLALQMHQERDEIWLFDCGEATQHQILQTTIKPRKITKIFITHIHGDHIFGLPGLLSSRSFQDGNTTLEIYGPKGVQEFVESALTLSETRLRYPIHYQELHEGVIFEDEHIRVKSMQLVHGVPSYGFVIEEANQIGPLLPDRLKSLGIKPGPIYEQIKANEVVTLNDGTTINRDDVTGPMIPGRKIAILGDTLPYDRTIDFIRNSNVLVHEATFIDEDADLASDYNHSTNTQAVKIADEAQVKHVLLNHISSRYLRQDLENELDTLKQIHPSVNYVYDFDTFQIQKEG